MRSKKSSSIATLFINEAEYLRVKWFKQFAKALETEDLVRCEEILAIVVKLMTKCKDALKERDDAREYSKGLQNKIDSMEENAREIIENTKYVLKLKGVPAEDDNQV